MGDVAGLHTLARGSGLLLAGAIAGALLGCSVPILSLPLNAPGYGHRYRIITHDKPPTQADDATGELAKTGLILLVSEFHISERKRRVGCYPIENGVATVPPRILQSRWWWPNFRGPPYVTISGWQNPDLTKVTVVVPGMGLAEFEFDGLQPPPAVINLYPIDEETEREALMITLQQFGLMAPSADDKAVEAAKEYFYKRASELQ